MNGWRWLNDPPFSRRFVLRVLAKAAVLFAIVNIAFALFNPLDFIGKLTIYNGLVPGRVRLPYGEDARSYNLSLDNLDAMFASHAISQPKRAGEFRVIFIGDSSVWGILLKSEDTVTGVIDSQDLTLDDGRFVRAYNLGHPILALSKDLLILDYAKRYQPDMIVWLTTLRSFPRNKQFDAPLVQRNAPAIRRLFSTYRLDYDLHDPRLADPAFLERTVIGQRRALADWLRLQLYGVMWAATGIDQVYPPTYDPVTSDFEADLHWEDVESPRPLTTAHLAFDLVEAGQEMAGQVPLLIVNEPIFASQGIHSDLRYNLWYPRWAYDQYRQLFKSTAEAHGWHYLDLWNMIDGSEFTDSPVHLTPVGSRLLAARLASEIVATTRAQENLDG